MSRARLHTDYKQASAGFVCVNVHHGSTRTGLFSFLSVTRRQTRFFESTSAPSRPTAVVGKAAIRVQLCQGAITRKTFAADVFIASISSTNTSFVCVSRVQSLCQGAASRGRDVLGRWVYSLAPPQDLGKLLIRTEMENRRPEATLPETLDWWY